MKFTQQRWMVKRWKSDGVGSGEWVVLYESVEESDCYQWAAEHGIRDVIVAYESRR